jgi:two-component system, NarL family, nitrate/nitrite response regulator NarL
MERGVAAPGRAPRTRPRVALIAAEPCLRLGLESALGKGFVHAGTAGSIDEAQRLVVQLRPCLAVLALSPPLPGGSVEVACRTLIGEQARTRVLVLVQPDDAHAAWLARVHGAPGIYQTSADPVTVRAALRSLAAGATDVDPAVARLLRSHAPGTGGAPGTRASTGGTPAPRAMHTTNCLTSRELHALRLLADGASASDIARALSSSVRAVDLTVGRAMRRLGASHRAQAVAIAARLGLLC